MFRPIKKSPEKNKKDRLTSEDKQSLLPIEKDVFINSTPQHDSIAIELDTSLQTNTGNKKPNKDEKFTQDSTHIELDRSAGPPKLRFKENTPTNSGGHFKPHKPVVDVDVTTSDDVEIAHKRPKKK